MMLWQATPASLWQGRDDSAEAPNALRLFQTIARAERFAHGIPAIDQHCSSSAASRKNSVSRSVFPVRNR